MAYENEGFMQQIRDDIQALKQSRPELLHIDNEEYAFNYWILWKIYDVDEEVLEDHVTEFSDKGIDCFVFYEDIKELHLIQLKYYQKDTTINANYAIEFLTDPLDYLEKGDYKPHKKLQYYYDKYKNDPDFSISFDFYITKNAGMEKFKENFDKCNNDKGYTFSINKNCYLLRDLQEKYTGDRYENKKSFRGEITTINKGTMLNIDTDNYPQLENLKINARYVMTPIKALYELVKASKNDEFQIYSSNIREYLGSGGKINKKMRETLEDPKERKNFFYYNNGITIIANKIDKEFNQKDGQVVIGIENPQIVNGAQTTKTIYEVLDAYSPLDLESDFNDTFVMTKLLLVSEEEKELTEDIVRYNNSQNAIKEEDFEKAKQENLNLKKDFIDNFGIYIFVKQSDRISYKDEYPKGSSAYNKLKHRSEAYFSKFGIPFEKNNTVELVNLLQVLVAYFKSASYAHNKKPHILKVKTPLNHDINVILKEHDIITRKNIMLLLLFYMKAKQKITTGVSAFYVIEFLKRYKEKNYHDLNDNQFIEVCLNDSKNLEKVFEEVFEITRVYFKLYMKRYDKSYNEVTKAVKVDEESYEQAVDLLN